MRAIFCGNFEYDARQSELERLFRKYGKVDKVDMKSGFAFIYMEDERDAEDAIRALDRMEFGRKGRRLRVEWTKQERGGGGGGGGGGSRRSRSSKSNLKPSKTLFVINFDPHETRTRDLERHFEPYGKIVSVRIRRNFAFVQYEYQEDATKALDATNMSKLLDRVISVEYAARDDDERRDGYGSDRDRYRSPERRRRSPSPYRRERGSPDYGRGAASPYQSVRGSPDYGRGRSPTHRRERTSPDYGRGPSQSPRRRERSRSHGDRGRSYSRSRSQSPYEERRDNPENSRVISGGPYEGQKKLQDRSRSPYRRERDSYDLSRSPHERENERVCSDNGKASPHSPEEGEKLSPENGHEHLPRSSEPHDSSPNRAPAESPLNGRDYSGSPVQD